MAPRKCGSCDRTFGRSEEIISCSACKRKYHANCSQLSQEEQAAFAASSRLKWFCILCEQDVDHILNNYEKFQKVSDAIRVMKEENETRFVQIEKRLLLLEADKKDNNVHKVVEDQVKKSAALDMEEIALRKSKESNMIYFGLPESDDDSIAVRMRQDFKFLSEAYGKDIDNEEINNIFRVGKKENGKIRPLVVKYASSTVKDKFLKSSGDLKIKFNNQMKPIYASVDRTEKQRESHKKLVEEFKRRKQSGEENIVIRGERIIENFQRDSGVQRISWASLFRNQ